MGNANTVIIKMQIALNKRMFERKKISYDMYLKADEVLIIK